MARFKYLGEPPRPSYVAAYGKTTSLRVPKKDGSKTVVNAPTPDGFKIGEEIPFDFTDPQSLTVMRADPRFQEV